MSDFDPSLLEGKDRNELVAIATSLGHKPPSRAKKAEIVALIMDLVGATPTLDLDGGGDAGAPGAAAPAGDADEAPRQARDAAGAPQEGARSGRAEQGSNGQGGEGRGRRGPAEQGQGGGQPQPKSGQPPAKQGQNGGGQGGGNQGGGSPKGQGGGNPGASAKGQGGQNQNAGGQNQGGGNQGNQGGQGQNGGNQGGQPNPTNQGGGVPGGEEPVETGNRAEPQPAPVEDGEGNRRRRRRGRDRNRNQDAEQVQAEPVDVEGIVDLRDEGYGFLRVGGYLPTPEDAYIAIKQVRQFGLRKGDVLTGRSRAANRNEKNPALVQIDTVNGHPVADGQEPPARPAFEDLTPVFPTEPLRLEGAEDGPEGVTARLVDLLAPLGKGQRGLVVAPPGSGKTTLVKHLVRGIERNPPDVAVLVVLLDERPEDVTDLRRWVLDGEVAAATFDRPAEDQIALAELAVERAKRLVEAGRDVVVVLDGLTALTRAHNLEVPASGRTLDGGLDVAAVHPPKRLLGAARNLEEGGSLTILATVAVETGSRLDEAIYEEVERTTNLELRLDRRLAGRRTFPALDVDATAGRHEDLLYPAERLARLHDLRRTLADLRASSGSAEAGLRLLLDQLAAHPTNADLLDAP